MGWPKFELTAFSGWDAIPPEARNGLLRVGVPKNSLGRLYWALDEPISVEVPGYGRLIRFGNTGLSGGIYVDPSSEQVLQLTDHPASALQLVNTSLEQFASTVKAIIDMFPFYESDSELEERMNAATHIFAAISQIDPAAFTPDSFWATFVVDVVTGDYSTEDVIGRPLTKELD